MDRAEPPAESDRWLARSDCLYRLSRPCSADRAPSASRIRQRRTAPVLLPLASAVYEFYSLRYKSPSPQHPRPRDIGLTSDPFMARKQEASAPRANEKSFRYRAVYSRQL